MAVEMQPNLSSQLLAPDDNHNSNADPNSISNLSPLSSGDVIKCNMCLNTTQVTLGHSTCHHVFCAPCFKSIQCSDTPESCPLCVYGGLTSENGVTAMGCSGCKSMAGYFCVHCSLYMSNACQDEHIKGSEFMNHIVLDINKVKHVVNMSAKWQSTHTDTSFWSSVEAAWPSDTSHIEKSWTNAGGASVLDQSWMNSSDNVWGVNGIGDYNKKWMQSTAKKGCPTDGLLALPPTLREPHSDESLMYSGSSGVGAFGDSSDPTTGSSSAELHSLYDQVIAPQVSGLCYNSSSIGNSLSDSSSGSYSLKCARHEHQNLAAYCKICETGVCSLCIDGHDGACRSHEFVLLQKEKDSFIEHYSSLLAMQDRTRNKTEELSSVVTSVEDCVEKLKQRLRDDEVAIRDAFDVYLKALIDRRQEIGAELQAVYKSKFDQLKEIRDTTSFNVQQLGEAKELIKTLLILGGPQNERTPQLTHIFYQLRTTLENIFSYSPDFDRKAIEEIRFVTNYQAIHAAVRNTFGFVKQRAKETSDTDLDGIYPLKKVFSAVELTSNESLNDLGYITAGFADKFSYGKVKPTMSATAIDSKMAAMSGNFLNDALGARLDKLSGSFPSIGAGLDVGKLGQIGLGGGAAMAPGLCESRTMALRNGFSIISLESEDEMSKVIMPSFCPTEFKRKKMEYHVKFGEFGCESHQFYEPSGVAVTPDNHILVADANNHRIQSFDCNGNYLKTIGQDHINGGEGDLVYPNRLAVNQTTGDIIVTERSPTHQVNIYNKVGRFMRKFGASILQHPHGIAVDNLGRIIVVECKVMRVVIFSIVGSVLNRFIVDKHVNFPNGVAVNDKEEIFISDNRRHGVVVFDYHGSFLRTIGGMGITNYPIGVGISSTGEVVVADNHNNFNITVFSQEGAPLRALESRVKHAQCFDIALLDHGSIVLSSKDFRVYVYQYGSVPVELNPLAAPVVPMAFRQAAGYMG